MLVKSNSVPNFLFETPKTMRYKLRLNNYVPKVLPYSEFLKQNPKATKSERRNAIKNFYDMLLNK